MRQIVVQVPRGYGEAVRHCAENHDGINLIQFTPDDQAYDVVIVHLSNTAVGPFLNDLDPLPNVHTTLLPLHVLPMAPPATEVVQQIVDVTPRSPVEVWLNGLQSVGSWKSFLGYTVAAGIVVWIGMFTNTIYLVVAAMLLAPFASPAMNTAIATASGDDDLLRRSMIRYVGSLVVTIAVTAALSLVLRQQETTQMMISVSQIATMAVLLPIVAGAAGALNLVQMEGSSLVSGSAVGIMIAASLAPPAGLVGMAGALGEWEMARNGVFLLVLQLVAINLSGSLVFRYYGLSPIGSRYKRGSANIFRASMAVSVVLLIGLLVWQMGTPEQLQRASLEQRLTSDARTALEESGLVEPVDVTVRLTGAEEETRALFIIYAHRQPDTDEPDAEVRREITRVLEDTFDERELYTIHPLFDITVLPSPSTQ